MSHEEPYIRADATMGFAVVPDPGDMLVGEVDGERREYELVQLTWDLPRGTIKRPTDEG